jgi:hypothetical protein
MAIDYGEKERAFIDGLTENTGRDLAAWMAAISAEDLPHRNDIIDWLRRRGFMFSKASWLERIHHNSGRPIYGDSAGAPRERARRREKRALPAAATASPERPAPPAVAGLDELLANAKAYRPLAQYLIDQIRSVRPGANLAPRSTFIAVSDPKEFARLGIGAKELRLHLALGSHPTGEGLKKGAPGGGLGKDEALSHMLVLTDARQIDRQLLDLVARAAANVNG